MDIIRKIEQENMRMDMPAFRSGDTVKVHLRIVEGEKERIQVFQGNVIRIKRGTTNAGPYQAARPLLIGLRAFCRRRRHPSPRLRGLRDAYTIVRFSRQTVIYFRSVG